MQEIIDAAATHRGGYVFRGDLIDCGLTDRHIARACHAGMLIRLRHGTYAPADSFRELSVERRHLLVAYSIVDKLGPNVALSHHSAAIAHGAVVHNLDLAAVHVTRLDGRGGRHEAGVNFHVGRAVFDEDICLVDGRQVVVPARAVVESCSLSPVESGMVTASFVLRSGGCSTAELSERVDRHARWPGMLKVRLSTRMADPRCESVGEVRSLYMFATCRIPRPTAQFDVRNAGRSIARADFGWEDARHVGEFDGRVKYGRLNPYDGDNAGQVLVDEKRREDAIRELGFGMSRWTWDELAPHRRPSTGARIATALERSRHLYTSGAVVIA